MGLKVNIEDIKFRGMMQQNPPVISDSMTVMDNTVAFIENELLNAIVKGVNIHDADLIIKNWAWLKDMIVVGWLTEEKIIDITQNEI